MRAIHCTTSLTPLLTLTIFVAMLHLNAKAAPADLSMLSDFGQPDIVLYSPAPGNVAAQKAGIQQVGSGNKAFIEQTGNIGNNAEVWQTGSVLSTNVLQDGSSNDLHLSQTGDHQTAVLDQVGTGNQMAIRQMESSTDLSSAQVGNDNQLVLQQYGNSQFQSSQIGDRNQIVVDLPNGMYLSVQQVGNDKSFSFHPVTN